MIPKDWDVLPMWTSPLEPLTEEAIALMCDADSRPTTSMDTLLIRLWNVKKPA